MNSATAEGIILVSRWINKGDQELNWDAVAAIGQIIGALAVVATLFYLAVQIRQNSQIVEEHSRQIRLGKLMQPCNRFRVIVLC